jgi:hypothetical protein
LSTTIFVAIEQLATFLTPAFGVLYKSGFNSFQFQNIKFPCILLVAIALLFKFGQYVWAYQVHFRSKEALQTLLLNALQI